MEKIAEQMQACGRGALYLKLLDVSNREILSGSFHDINRFLLPQRAFWQIMLDAERCSRENFSSECTKLSFGSAHLHLCGKDEILKGFDSTFEDLAHLMAVALLTSSSNRTLLRHGHIDGKHALWWMRGLLTSAHSWRNGDCINITNEFSQFFASCNGLEYTLIMHISNFWIESLLSVLHQRGPHAVAGMLAEPQKDCNIDVVWALGPLVLLDFSFPAWNRWADVSWTKVLDAQQCDDISEHTYKQGYNLNEEETLNGFAFWHTPIGDDNGQKLFSWTTARRCLLCSRDRWNRRS